MIIMQVQAMTVDPRTQQRVVWLRGRYDNMVLPFRVGDTEAMSIQAKLAGESLERPLAHDLIASVLERFDARLEEVEIAKLEGHVLCAKLVFSWRKGFFHLEGQSSDAVALALKYDAPIYLSEEVLVQAGYRLHKTSKGTFYVERCSEGGMLSSPGEVDAAIEALLASAGIEEREVLPEEAQSPEERVGILRGQIRQAVRLECYEEAARILKEVERIEREQEPGKTPRME